MSIGLAVWKMAGVQPGAQLPACAWPGGYNIRYITEDGDSICAECVNKVWEFRHERSDPQWNIVACDVYWEGPPEWCHHCGVEMPSEYGDPDFEELEEVFDED